MSDGRTALYGIYPNRTPNKDYEWPDKDYEWPVAKPVDRTIPSTNITIPKDDETESDEGEIEMDEFDIMRVMTKLDKEALNRLYVWVKLQLGIFK